LRALGFVFSFPEKSTVQLWEEKKMNDKIDEENLRDAEVRCDACKKTFSDPKQTNALPAVGSGAFESWRRLLHSNG
jgi:hypothetical protein